MPWDSNAALGGTVVLAYPLASSVGERLNRTGFLVPPLGVLYLSAQLKRHGIPVHLVNEEIDGDVLPRLMRLPAAQAPLLVGVYVNDASAERVIELLRGRDPAVRTVVGGPATIDAQRFLAAGAAAACVGEGEEAILDLVAWARGEKDLSDIPGLMVGAGKGGRETARRLPIADLDTLPIPDWDSYPPDRIPFDNLYPPVERPLASVMTSRGCPMRCAYCSSPTIWSRTVRRRSVDSVVGELDELIGRFGVRFVDVYDDIFNLGRDWTQGFCEALIRRGTPVRWSAYYYPVGFDAELLRLAKAAGLSLFKIGVQSGSPRILENIGRRPATLEQARLYLDETARLGIFSAVDFIFGLPGETRETVEESARYIRRLQADSLKLAKLRVLPGSPLHVRGLTPAVELDEAALDSAIRRVLFSYYLRPARLLKTARWGMKRGLSWGRVRALGKLTRVALAGEVFPGAPEPPAGQPLAMVPLEARPASPSAGAAKAAAPIPGP